MPFQSAYPGCLFCGDPLRCRNLRDQLRKRFCSRECRARWHYAHRGLPSGHRPNGHFPPKHARHCEFCGATYQPNGAKQRWCFECVPPEGRWRGLATRYRISKPMWEAMLDAQDWHCALCPNEATVVDHDHETSAVRGLLCNPCNVALHWLEKEEWRERAEAYLAV